ncbi:MAG TPA: thermonuclease family protein [Rhodospirillales bacterium]|nr:thermonuclease family protein [Rhodospirillales bacterium]
MRRVALLLLVIALPARAESLSGPARVIGGDRLEVAGRTLRLAGIDAPEPGQRCTRDGREYSCGRIAATALMDLTAGVTVACEILGAGDPAPARCRLPDGYDLSEGMVYTGWALAFPREDNPLLAQETIARERRHGLWRGRFVPPWKWRQTRAQERR